MSKTPSAVRTWLSIAAVFCLAAVLLVRVVLDTTRIARGHAHLSMLYEGLRAYAADNGGDLPDMHDMARVERSLYPRYVKGRHIFYDPYTGGYFETNPSLSFRPLAPIRLCLPPRALHIAREPDQRAALRVRPAGRAGWVRKDRRNQVISRSERRPSVLYR